MRAAYVQPALNVCGVHAAYLTDRVQVTLHILGPVLTVTVFASLVAYAWHTGHNVTMTNSVTPLLSVVVSREPAFSCLKLIVFCEEGGPYFGVQVSILSCIASCASLILLKETGNFFRRFIVLGVADRLLQHFI